MEMKRKMIDKAEVPLINNKVPWQKPNVLQWLDQLAKRSELCEVNSQGEDGNELKGIDRASQLHII